MAASAALDRRRIGRASFSTGSIIGALPYIKLKSSQCVGGASPAQNVLTSRLLPFSARIRPALLSV
ncbi:hypothetical protein C2U68_04155 [Methylomonas koyamae]|nr:hypothetical protein C2U68_04155 [Methylomonas koyamae]